MKHNASPEKTNNENAKRINDFDSGKTTNKGILFVIYSMGTQGKKIQT